MATSEGARKAQESIRKRMGEDKYIAVRRRAGSVKTRGYFGWLKDNDPEKLKQIVTERTAKMEARKAEQQP